MSTLQISLAIIGGLVLAGVVAYNAWVTRQSTPRTARETEDHADRSSNEPAMSHGPLDPHGHSEADRIEPVLDGESLASEETRPGLARIGNR